MPMFTAFIALFLTRTREKSQNGPRTPDAQMSAHHAIAVLVPDHSDPRHGILAELGTVDPHLIMKMMPDTKTPCVNLCKIDQVSGLCIGCARNLIEIAGWREFSDQERRQIMDDLPRRLRTDLRRNQQ